MVVLSLVAADKSAEIERLRADAQYGEFLIAAGELLSSSLDYRKTLRTVCKAAAESIADLCILEIGSVNDRELVAAAHRQVGLTPQLELSITRMTHEEGRPAHPVWTVLDRGQPVLVPHIDEAWIEQHASSERHAELMRSMHYRSMIVVPVRSQIWGITGALTLVRTDLTDRPYDVDALRFAQDLGRRCGIAIGKARLHSQTLDIAERFQKAALPHSLPDIPGFVLDAFYEPADAALLVGGDWYDAFLLRDGNLGISIGDIAGHGVESAALMSSIRNAIRMALIIEPDVTAVLRDADFLFRNETELGMLCTAFVAVVDRNTGTMTCASAGHPSALVWSRGVITSVLDEPDLPLGCGDLAGEPPQATTIRLEPASTVVLYTDGLLESSKDYEAGESALRNALMNPAIRNAHHPARALRDAVIPGAHADDVSVLTFRYEGSN